MARQALTLATNQGLIYVLSMVVVGGLVGAGALGYDVVAGFSQGQLYGKGLAAGIAIVVLGVMLDRLTRTAAAKRWTNKEVWKWRHRVLGAALSGASLLLAAVEPRSGTPPSGATGDCGTFNIAINPWVGYEANAAVLAYVAETELGCTVTKKDLKEEVAWQGFGTGEVDAVVENWGHDDLKKKYIDEQKTARRRVPPASRDRSAGTCRRGSPRSTRTSPTGTT